MWKIIASIDQQWGIGKENQLLVQIPQDMQFFQKKTWGQILVMGRKTFESFPNGQVLKGRENLILTTNKTYFIKNGLVLHTIEDLCDYLKQQQKQIYVIGGESIYRQLLPYCDEAYITKIDATYSCDTYFPNLEADQEWELVSESKDWTYLELNYRFTKYERKRRC